MLRDINQAPRISNVTYQQEKMSRKLPLGFFEEMLMGIAKYPSQDRAALLLVIASFLREDIPWLYELVMEIYRAVARGTAEEINSAHQRLFRVMKLVSRGPLEKYLFRISDDGMFRTREIINMLDMMLSDFNEFEDRPPSRRRSKPGSITS